jgi:type I restriction enzyme, S subunit
MRLSCPEGWELVKLSDLGEVNRGRSRHRPRHAPHLYGGVYPFIQTGDVKASGGRITSYQQTYSEAGLAQSRLWPAGTLCITIAANIAETGILQFPACFPDSVIGFIANPEKCDVQFVEYTFRHIKRLIQHAAKDGGTVQDNINLGTFETLRFPIPKLDEQRTIARILGALDDKIELNRQMNRTLEAMAQALFKSWFVDFDPVTAKAARRKPYGMDEATAALFPNRFVESESGLIPKGWRAGSLSEIANINTRKINGKFPHKTIEYIDISSVICGHLEGTTQLEIESAPSRAQRLVSHGDTIWSCVRPNRKSYLLIQHPASNIVVSTGFAVLSPKGRFASYLHLWVTTDDFTDYLTANAEGSAYPAVRPEIFASARVLIPSSDILEIFENKVSSLFELREQNCSQSETLASVRDALLPKLLSGEIRVRRAENLIAEAV